MEHFGLLALIPPVLTVVLAIWTKDVIISLFLGILSGTLIVAGGKPFTALSPDWPRRTPCSLSGSPSCRNSSEPGSTSRTEVFAPSGA